MKKRYWGLALCAALCVGMLSGCSWNSGTVSRGAGAIAEKKEQDSSAEKTEKTEKPEDSTEPETEEVTQAETEAETEISAAETAASGELPANETKTVTDATGDFSYTGELMWIGDEAHGFLQVPASYQKFQDTDVSGLVQYCQDPYNVVTLQKYTDVDRDTAANAIYTALQGDSGCEDLLASQVTLGTYDAKQIAGYYPATQQFLVAWIVEDPENPKSSYYLAMEFTENSRDMMGCSSTFTCQRP